MWQLSTALLAVSITTSLATSAHGASIFAFDRQPSPEPLGVPIISGETAKRLLEVRMAAPRASLGKLDQSTVELLDKFGGPSTPLFTANSKGEKVTRSLVIIEGVDPSVDASLRNTYHHSLTVSKSGLDLLDSGLVGLFLDFESGATVPNGRYCLSQFGSASNLAASQVAEDCLHKNPVFDALPGVFDGKLSDQVDTVESWVDEERSVSASKLSLKPIAESAPSEPLLHKIFQGLQSPSLTGMEATVLLMPESTNKMKNSTARGDSKVSFNGQAKRNFELQAALPLPVAPVCYASNSSCNDATNSCSGHGLCYKKSSSADEESTGDCFACKCEETIVRKNDGTVQKVQWGGPACQKRDISSPFFLIAGVTILVILAMSTAVGMLFHVGQGELPGVISAGVGATHSAK